MPSEHRPADGASSVTRAVRHHLVLVAACLTLGAAAGWGWADSSPATYTSSAKVLVNPAAGNPFAPTPASVRQDQATSLETEAQLVGSVEVLQAAAEKIPDGPTTAQLERRVQVTVPANTQILQISYTGGDPAMAQQVVDAVSVAYLENRDRRSAEVTNARIDRLQTQTARVVKDLRAATAAAEIGTRAQRNFQSELADALRNDLVNLRAQRAELENSDSPAGAVVSPASSPASGGTLTELVLPVGGALAGLALGCLLALLLERLRGVVRSTREVESTGLPVVAAVPPRPMRARLSRKTADAAFDETIRRLRATILDADPRPGVVSVAAAGEGASEPLVAEAVAESFAKAGHLVVLVRTEDDPSSLLAGGPGLAQALVDEHVDVKTLVKPSAEPLLSVLSAGRITPQSRELLVADRLRAVLAPLIDSNHLVVIQSPAPVTAAGSAVAGVSDLGLVVVTTGRTRRNDVEVVARQERVHGPGFAGLVVDRPSVAHRTPLAPRSGTGLDKGDKGEPGGRDGDAASGSAQRGSTTPNEVAPARR
jgi:capsular polysaccharide biosynthesis protein